ncbi:MAG: hypothetical protein AB1424_01790 [Thermodesulfobacteriota bacterium]
MDRNTWAQIASLCLIVIVWSGYFIIISILADLLMDKYFRGDADALLIWLVDFDHRLLVFTMICWLIVFVMVVVAKLQEWFIGRAKQVEDSLEQSRELVK